MQTIPKEKSLVGRGLQKKRLSHLKLARQSGWKKGYPKNPVFMDMDLPGITDTGADGNLVKRHACLPKAVYPLTCNKATGQLQPPSRGIDHEEFCKILNEMPLPYDDAERANFDQQDVFILGDPAASFDRSGSHSYDRKSSDPHAGLPEWKKIFSYILRDCGYLVDYDTVYVLVDTRDLANHAVRDPGLPHWQAAVAWWESRLQMTGPMGERTELCFFPASEHTGLHNVHPTWAGTFVLAALGASFPGKHFFLLDSDCLPVTLFEAFDLWQEAYLTRFPMGAEESRKLPHPLLQYQRFQRDCYVKDTREGTSHQKMGQGVVLVTEPHAELNAGFVGLCF